MVTANQLDTSKTASAATKVLYEERLIREGTCKSDEDQACSFGYVSQSAKQVNKTVGLWMYMPTGTMIIVYFLNFELSVNQLQSRPDFPAKYHARH